MGIEWSKDELKELKKVGEKLKRALDRIPVPKEPEYPENTAEMLAIWDEEEGWRLEDIERLKGLEVIYNPNKAKELKDG